MTSAASDQIHVRARFSDALDPIQGPRAWPALLLAFAYVLMASLPVLADAQTCTPVDHRKSTSLPARSQLYKTESSQGFENKDSRYCYAYSLAALVSQELQISIEPLDIAIQFMKSWPSVKSSEMFPLNFGWGGDITSVFSGLQNIGYCPTDDFNHYRRQLSKSSTDWYIALHQQSQIKSPEQIFEDVELHCSRRLHLPKNLSLTTLQNNDLTRFEGTMVSKTVSAFMDIIDQKLDQGRLITLSYDFHYVTIIGRTASCEYIIQDSIPISYRRAHNFRNFANRVDGEHIQYWSRSALIESLHWNGGQLPGISYLAD